MRSWLETFAQRLRWRELTRDERSLLLRSWPEDFGELYTISLGIYKRVLADSRWRSLYRYYELEGVEPVNWHHMERFKVQALAIVQVIASGVTCYCNGDETWLTGKAAKKRSAIASSRLSPAQIVPGFEWKKDTGEADLLTQLVHLGGLHKRICKDFAAQWFDEYLQIAVDVIMTRPAAQQLTESEQAAARELWEELSKIMCAALKFGFDMNAQPDTTKLKRAYDALA